MIIHAIITGIVAWVFVLILLEEGMIFEWWWNVLNKLPDLLAKPLGKCEYCLSGQLALWYFIYYSWGNYSIFWHIGFISIAILTTKMINVIVYGNEND